LDDPATRKLARMPTEVMAQQDGRSRPPQAVAPFEHGEFDRRAEVICARRRVAPPLEKPT